MKVKLLVCGGTMDKCYDLIHGRLYFSESHIRQMLEQARCKVDVDIDVVMLKDSLDMSGSDRQKILKCCQDCREKKIIITHGTDTMVDTARLIGDNLKDKTVVLTGAMVPYCVDFSDALFNLGCAVTAVQTLKSGVFILMNGLMFECHDVVKNKNLGIFESC